VVWQEAAEPPTCPVGQVFDMQGNPFSLPPGALYQVMSSPHGPI